MKLSFIAIFLTLGVGILARPWERSDDHEMEQHGEDHHEDHREHETEHHREDHGDDDDDFGEHQIDPRHDQDDHEHDHDDTDDCDGHDHDNHKRHGDDDDDCHRHRSHRGHAVPVHTTSFHGVRFPPSQRGEESDRDQPIIVPIGHPTGPIVASTPPINFIQSNATNETAPRVKRQDQCGGSGVIFDTSTIYSSNTQVGSNGETSEPSGARAGNVVFSTFNWFAAISIDGGATFNPIDPTAFTGPANGTTDEGFCCDQVVEYLPSIDRFVWLLQYSATAKKVNKLRLVTFHPSDVTATAIKSWIYMDIVTSDLGFPSWLDFGELAVGNTWLHMSATLIGTGLTVFRIPIAALNVVGPLTYSYTAPRDGAIPGGARLTQNPGDTVFWAGHSSLGSRMRVFRWREADTNYAWNDVDIKNFPTDGSKIFSACPNNATHSWTRVVFNVMAATRRSANEVWFGWPAPSGHPFPFPHVQIVQFDVSGWPQISLIKQWQVWNPNFAFSFPAFYTNRCQDVGLAVAFGGNGNNPTSAVGVLDSHGVLTQTVYYPELSDTCEFRFGDYLTVRSSDGFSYDGFIYALQSGEGTVIRNERYVQFRRG